MRVYATNGKEHGYAQQNEAAPLQTQPKDGAARGALDTLDALGSLSQGAAQLRAAPLQRAADALEPQAVPEFAPEEDEVTQGRFATQRQEDLDGAEQNSTEGTYDEEPLQAKAAAAGTQHGAQSGANASPGGLPAQLRAGAESLSGLSLADVSVRYNSPEPAKIQAHAYTRGTEIHVAPGQEKHLPHEAWHVVQQKQGRVQATRQLKGQTESVSINDYAGLEREADVMGGKAASNIATGAGLPQALPSGKTGTSIAQLVRKRVLGNAPTVEETDIFFDKSDGKYYNGMKEEKLFAKDYNTIETAARKHYDILGKIVAAPLDQAVAEKERSGNTLILRKATPFIPHKPACFIKAEHRELMPYKVGRKEQAGLLGTKVTSGSPLSTPPPAIRLYAEGNMAHAVGLAKSIDSEERYRQFLSIGQPAPALEASGVPLIKASELRSLDAIEGQYASQIAGRPKGREGTARGRRIADTRSRLEKIKRGEFSNLEASFGGGLGHTGDMGREVKANSYRRLYDVIQSTFFWIPQMKEKEDVTAKNLKVLTDFMRNQCDKLKPGGILRVVGVNTDGAAATNKYVETAKAAKDAAADKYESIEFIELKKVMPAQEGVYSKALGDLNPDGEFEHLRTDDNDIVTSSNTHGDYIIIAKKSAAEPEEAGVKTTELESQSSGADIKVLPAISSSAGAGSSSTPVT